MSARTRYQLIKRIWLLCCARALPCLSGGCEQSAVRFVSLPTAVNQIVDRQTQVLPLLSTPRVFVCALELHRWSFCLCVCCNNCAVDVCSKPDKKAPPPFCIATEVLCQERGRDNLEDFSFSSVQQLTQWQNAMILLTAVCNPPLYHLVVQGQGGYACATLSPPLRGSCRQLSLNGALPPPFCQPSTGSILL